MKAHIARNQNAGVPLALGWNLSAADRGILEGMAHDVSRVLLRAVQRQVYAAEHDPRDRHLRVADEARSEAAERRVNNMAARQRCIYPLRRAGVR